VIVVTGATGHLGRLVVERLRETLPAGEVVAAVRTPEKAVDLGVEVRHADYDEPDTLVPALDGADKVLLISAPELGGRFEQHQAVIDAATKVGVSQLVYTSAPQADTSELVVVPEHKATEAALRTSGLTYTILRNGWYNENFQPAIEQAVRTGSFAGSAGSGRVASAARKDFADAAVAVLTGPNHADATYELSGDSAWTYADLAATLSDVTGREVTYQDLSPQEHVALLVSVGLPQSLAEFVVTVEQGTKAGWLGEVTSGLSDLIGRPSTPMRDTVLEIVSSL